MLPFPPSKKCCFEKNVSSSPLVILSSYTKIRCRTKPFLPRSFWAKGQTFSIGIETKINLVAPRRQTVLRNSPTRPATPCARPGDLQIANWKARTLS
ncbi:hypothetical protein AVEN_270539-1 [Araneus ventricosus]|uniref:Uncharacterized protein n=1 Tax=Araneus ventricosus TaxID=182803 RepID=A0A4Y2B7G0_ARAVE|nr:hypothetical protein AVEN_270539-1 [Araneus ventricosus]